MKKYTVAYLLWLAGVLSFAAVAYAYYRRVQAMGEDAVVHELRTRRDGDEAPVAPAGNDAIGT